MYGVGLILGAGIYVLIGEATAFADLYDTDKVLEYLSRTHRVTHDEKRLFDEIARKTLDGKMSTQYEYYGQNDPFVVADY